MLETEMSSSEHSDSSAESENEHKNTLKRKKCPEAWKKNARKQARLSGKQYTTESGKLVQEKTTGPDCM